MQLEIEHDPVHDCCHLRVSGTLYLADYTQAFRAAWEREEYTAAARALWDFREAQPRLRKDELKALRELMSGDATQSVSQAAVAAVRELADFTRAERPPSLPPRIALLVSSDLDFGMMRMYVSYATLDDVDARVFRTPQDAWDWLLEAG